MFALFQLHLAELVGPNEDLIDNVAMAHAFMWNEH